MTIAVNDYVYQLTTAPPDRLGITWATLQRRVVEVIEAGSVILSRAVVARYPTHTPPETLADADWEIAADTGLTVPASMVGAGKTWDPAPDLGTAEVIDDETATAALLEHRNHKYNNRERGSPPPSLSLEQERLFAIAEYREGLRAWRR